MTSLRLACIALGLAAAWMYPGCRISDETLGTPLGVSTEQLGALFDEIIEKTERREAFSAIKETTQSYSALAEMKRLRSEFVAAETEEELFYALVKLSNARRDRHLSVNPVEGGLAVPETPELAAPVLVLPDFSDLDDPQFFVAGVGLDLPSPKPGDLIVAVNGRPIPEYVAEFTQWIRHSTAYGLYWHMAREMPLTVRNVPPHLYSETLNLALENAAGDRYDVSLPYGDPDTHAVGTEPEYDGFERVMERENFHVHVRAGERIVLLQWFDFERSLIQDVMDLVQLAEREELLDHDLIIDVRGSSGGSFGAYAIQRLVSRPFRTTFGNVRLSDAGEALIEGFQNLEVDENAPDIFGLNLSRSWLIDWARTDAAEAIRRGDEYTPPTPFKLAHLPRDSSGSLEPAPVHFRGRTAIIGGPHGGSHLDQFLSMFADNDLAVVVGMPTGGYSNTWEHEEVLTFPGTERPVAAFMWNIGHTLRPNTEILEGNPVVPDVHLALTRENFRTYDRELLRLAMDALRNP
ncbi:MAG: hypothetical protein J4G12_10175 [Gemmatimonadetes bacterium]|nr:hypothetical protein [Gemmatimonadota bacterium]